MVRQLIFLFLLIFVSSNGWSQAEDNAKADVYAEEDLYEDDPYFWSYSKEVGLNMTSLVSKFVPFNLGNDASGFVDFRWKKFYATRAFRLNLGANITDSENQFFHLSIGIEKRNPIAKSRKISYSSSWDLFVQADDNDGSFGISKGYGLEYHFTRRIYMSTEANLRLGLGSDADSLILNFDRPAAIFLHVRLY